MSYRGDISLSETIDIKFCTVTTTGAPTTLAGTPVVSAYPDNSLTQLTAGITLTVDFDGVTGLNNIRVVATGANGYATSTNYDLVITTGTVGGTSVVGYVVGSFSVEKRSALRPATAGRTLVVDAAGLADALTVKVGPTGAGTAQTAGDIATMITAVDDLIDTEVAAIKTDTAAILIDTGTTLDGRLPAALVGGRMDASVGSNLDKTGYSLSAAGIQAVWDALTAALATAGSIGKKLADWVIGTSQTGDSFARLGAPTGASISADIAAVQADTDNIQTRIPAALVSGRMDANASAIDDSSAAAANLKQSTLGIVTAVVGLASTTISIVTSSMSPAAAVIDQFKGKIVTFAEDTTTVNLRGQSTDITGSTATGVLTVTALTTAPVSGDTFSVT